MASAFVTYLQPFYNLRTERLQGFEALARRRNGQAGRAASPASPAAEPGATAPNLRDLDLWIVQDALTRIGQWHRSPQTAHLILSVNVSSDLVSHPHFAEDILRALAGHGIAGDRLLVDIPAMTFRQLRTIGARELSRLQRLQEHEIAFCIDGFTVADTDLLDAALAATVDIVKLHPSQLAGRHSDLAPLTGAIQDAGLPVVAAGVETPEQLDLARTLDVEWVQGFLLGEPAPAHDALQRSAPQIPR